MDEELIKREWVYLMRPKNFDMAQCSCGNKDCDWSEYINHLWCPVCQKDFRPEHGGIFDGPILMQVSALCGVYFDRQHLESGDVEFYDFEKKEFIRVTGDEYKARGPKDITQEVAA